MEISRVDQGSQQSVRMTAQEEIQGQGRQEESAERGDTFVRSSDPRALENGRALATEVQDVDQATGILSSLTAQLASRPEAAMLSHGSLDAEKVATLLAR